MTPRIGDSELKEPPAKSELSRSDNFDALSAHSEEQLQGYLPHLPKNRFEDARRAALLAVLAGCGLTGHELRTLPRKAVVLDEIPQRIWLPQLGPWAEATIALARFALPILLDYRRLLNAHGHKGNLFFPATIDTDSPLSHQTLHRYVVAALKAIGIEDRIGAQRVLRVNLAVRLLEYNFSEQKVQEILRLREDTMVKRYRRHTHGRNAVLASLTAAFARGGLCVNWSITFLVA